MFFIKTKKFVASLALSAVLASSAALADEADLAPKFDEGYARLAQETTSQSVDDLLALLRASIAAAAIAEEQREQQPEKGSPEIPDAAATDAAHERIVSEAIALASRTPDRVHASARDVIKARGFLWPVDGSIYSAFGATRGRRGHGAVDIVAPRGTLVAVCADGVVSVVADGGKLYKGYGRIIIVDHGDGVQSAYAHLDSFRVKEGQSVKRGEIIGTVGRTGNATNYLLHYEVRVDGRKIDPLLCMEERPGAVKMVNYRSSKSDGKKKR